jgi:hypothetical protein
MPITVDAGVENEAESKQREALREAGRKGARRSGEARRQKAERTDHEKTHETLVDSPLRACRTNSSMADSRSG